LYLECLPSKTFFQTNVFIKVETIKKLSNIDNSNDSNNSIVKEVVKTNIQLNSKGSKTWVVYIAPLTWILLLSIIYNMKYNPMLSIELVKYLRIIEDVFNYCGIELKKDLMIDSFVGFVSWPVTYMFIRRWLNPETRNECFKKYNQDTFFGGLAAACNVVLRSVLLSCIQSSK